MLWTLLNDTKYIYKINPQHNAANTSRRQLSRVDILSTAAYTTKSENKRCPFSEFSE